MGLDGENPASTTPDLRKTGWRGSESGILNKKTSKSRYSSSLACERRGCEGLMGLCADHFPENSHGEGNVHSKHPLQQRKASVEVFFGNKSLFHHQRLFGAVSLFFGGFKIVPQILHIQPVLSLPEILTL